MCEQVFSKKIAAHRDNVEWTWWCYSFLEIDGDFDVVEKAKWFLSDNNNHPPPIGTNEEKEEEEKNEHEQQDETTGRVQSLYIRRVSNQSFTFPFQFVFLSVV